MRFDDLYISKLLLLEEVDLKHVDATPFLEEDAIGKHAEQVDHEEDKDAEDEASQVSGFHGRKVEVVVLNVSWFGAF